MEAVLSFFLSGKPGQRLSVSSVSLLLLSSHSALVRCGPSYLPKKHTKPGSWAVRCRDMRQVDSQLFCWKSHSVETTPPVLAVTESDEQTQEHVGTFLMPCSSSLEEYIFNLLEIKSSWFLFCFYKCKYHNIYLFIFALTIQSLETWMILKCLKIIYKWTFPSPPYISTMLLTLNF